MLIEGMSEPSGLVVGCQGRQFDKVCDDESFMIGLSIWSRMGTRYTYCDQMTTLVDPVSFFVSSSLSG